ncbi:MAG: SDR family oxidoreductase [Candidatus Saganbacteria bacterium]|nr:SDR family oxidoreductase [Candidatus Saganbacteria bacterium]
MTNNILVTGHKGYLGSVLTSLLLRRNYRVSGVDTNYFQTRPLQCRGVTEQFKDIRSITPNNFRGITAVAHFAAIADDSSSQIVPETTTDINLAATLKLATMAKKAGVERFVFSSTCGVYGNTLEGTLLTETSPVLPNSPYTASKLEAEKRLTDLADSSFTPIFLRNATVFGWSDRNRFDSPVNNMAFMAVSLGKVKLRTNGLSWRPVVHVNDVARAFLLALEAPAASVWNELFNVGANELNFRLIDIANAACTAIGGGTPETEEGKVATSSYVCGFSKIKDTLGFSPLWSLNRGLEDMIRKIRESGNRATLFNHNNKAMRHLLSTGEIDSGFRWLKAGGEASET